MNEKGTLTRRQEELLLRYADGECGWLGRRRAEALLARDESAREFARAMQRTADEVRAAVRRESSVVEPDLWPRISMRLEQEERAAVFLGARRHETDTRRGMGWGLAWGMSGAVAAACIAALMIFQQSSPPSGVGQLVTQAPAVVPSVNLVSQHAAYQPPVMLEDDAPVQVDWLRSQGRVSMIQGPTRRSAIIWVNRNRQIYPHRRTQPGRGIRMVEDNVPVAVPVSK